MSNQENPRQGIQVLTRQAVLAESLEDGSPPFKIHGVAIAPGDITHGKFGKKFWPKETLEKAAASLEGRALVQDHLNSIEGNIGEVTQARFEEGKGVLFEAELDEKTLAEKINRGRLDVSARIKHRPTEELDEHESGAAIIDPPAVFDNLSVVNSGASSSNEVQLGESAALEENELREVFGESTDEVDESEQSEDVDPEDSDEQESADGSDDSEVSEGESSSEQDESAQEQTDDVSDTTVDDPDEARTVAAAQLSRHKNKFETMKNYDIEDEALPEDAELEAPVVVDKTELSDLEDKASRADEEFDDLRDSISELSDIKETKEELEEKVAELEEKAEEIDQVKETYAAQLAEAAGDVVEVDDFMHLEVSELRGRVEDLEDEEEDAELEDNDPDPGSEDVDNAELEDDDVDDEVDQEVADLEEKVDWYENKGWEQAAEEARTELSELKE